MERGSLGSGRDGGRRDSGSRWRSGREYKKVDQKEKADEKTSRKKNPLPSPPFGLKRLSFKPIYFLKIYRLHSKLLIP